MPTTNPKISAYVPQVVYDRFEEFYRNSKLSMSQAATLILAERFGFEEIIKKITKDTTVDISVLEEIKELKSRLEIVEEQLERIQDSSNLHPNQSFNEKVISKPKSELRGEPINESELIVDIKLDDKNSSFNGLPSEPLNELPEKERINKPQSSLESKPINQYLCQFSPESREDFNGKLSFKQGLAEVVIPKNSVKVFRKFFLMYSLYYKGLRLSVTFQVKHLCVGDFGSFAQFFAGFYFGRGID